MSGNDRPELRAFKELEGLVRNLGEELAMFRRRALQAETQLKDAGQAPSAKAKGGSTERPTELESENEALRARLRDAEDRVRQMMDRMRFLRQQVQAQSAAAGTGRS
jgi:small-conductance mechanosensitive channel